MSRADYVKYLLQTLGAFHFTYARIYI